MQHRRSDTLECSKQLTSVDRPSFRRPGIINYDIVAVLRPLLRQQLLHGIGRLQTKPPTDSADNLSPSHSIETIVVERQIEQSLGSLHDLLSAQFVAYHIDDCVSEVAVFR